MKQLMWLIIFLPMIVISQENPKSYGVIIMTSSPIEQIIQQYSELRSAPISYKRLGAYTNTYLLESNDDDAIYRLCQKNRNIIASEYNYMLAPRVRPNDVRSFEQYYLDVIKVFETWDVTTGGKDFKNNDLVIGVVDDGFELTHVDLKENIYLNPDEIANDNIDNDGNGYIDDINGWNTRSKTGVQDVKAHGTNILGVLGAKGNNNIGVTGMNWNIKLLTVSTGNLVSNVIEGYEYFINEKRIYRSSNGAKGANIVVSSYSGGLPKAFAANHPIWCAVYDKLGTEGILSVGATTNDADNVEIVGDMPSTCTSPYLMIVNSTNRQDELDEVTGFGAISVDISAPGERILTTALQSKNLYSFETGTSLSTPMVAGAAALLYSIKCENFYNLVKNQPIDAVLAVKDALIKMVDKKNSIQGKTVSGGRMNVNAALKSLVETYCSQELAPKGKLEIVSAKLVNDAITIDYISPDSKELMVKIFDSFGKLVYETTIEPPVFGNKKTTIYPDFQLSGMFYYVSLISGINVASRGFNAQDPTAR